MKKQSKMIWCSSCCQWIPYDPQTGAVHTCHDYIREIVEDFVPHKQWQKRKLLYQILYRISLRKDVYHD